MALARLVVHFMADQVTGLRAMSRVIDAGVVAACGAGSVERRWQVLRSAHEYRC